MPAGAVRVGKPVPEVQSPFARVTWEGDRLRAGGVSFLVQEYGAVDREPDVAAEPCVVLYKNRHTMDLYAEFFDRTPEFRPRRIFEVGIWKGGSAVLFAELFDIEKLVAIDLRRQADLSAVTLRQLEVWRRTHERGRRTELCWETDQRDGARLRSIVQEQFSDGRLDLVIDDGSHLHAPSRSTFESLFPYLVPGGWYVIEDWSWSFNASFQVASHPWALEVPLARLVQDLVALSGSRKDVVSGIWVAGQLVFVRRGPCELGRDFAIDGLISRAPYGRVGVHARRAWWSVSEAIARIRGKRSG